MYCKINYLRIHATVRNLKFSLGGATAPRGCKKKRLRTTKMKRPFKMGMGPFDASAGGSRASFEGRHCRSQTPKSKQHPIPLINSGVQHPSMKFGLSHWVISNFTFLSTSLRNSVLVTKYLFLSSDRILSTKWDRSEGVLCMFILFIYTMILFNLNFIIYFLRLRLKVW